MGCPASAGEYCGDKSEVPMPQRPEHSPGEPAPSAGTYEQLNVFGRSNGIRVDMNHGHPFPQAPVGHTSRSVEGDREEC
jgi:hypothetical protein